MYKLDFNTCLASKSLIKLLHVLVGVLFVFNPLPLFAEQLDLTGLSLEDLMGVKVTSVSKKEQSLSDSAAAIFVITNEDLKHSGVTNIPDALRMVPGLTVARIDSNKWAVNSRGTASRFGDKLLVLIDGRSVYTSSFSGVYWEVQNVMLEDVERIEVIRGPGATLWGANAVNGVINIITKHAEDTLGGLASVGGGINEPAFASTRYGTSLGENTWGRIYAKGFKEDEFKISRGDDAGDDWDMRQGGFRWESNLNANDSVNLQGDIYQGDINQQIILPSVAAPYRIYVDDDTEVSGGNLVASWQSILSSTSGFTLQAYYDWTEREEAFVHERRNSFDLDFQHRFSPGNRHDLVWGIRYRHTDDDFVNNPVFSIIPESQGDDLYSAFIQDEISLVQDYLRLTLGSKFEHNDYTGYEVQPGLRLLWKPCPYHRLWTSVSRAVRTPSRGESDGIVLNKVIPPSSASSGLPVVINTVGTSEYASEKLTAYELGYRFVPNQAFSLDVTTFYNNYDKARTVEAGDYVNRGTYIEKNLYFNNNFSAHSYGAEVSGTWQAAWWLKLDLACSYLVSDMEDGWQVGQEPTYQASLRSAFTPREDLDVDIWFRYVDNTSALSTAAADNLFEIDDYFTLDICLAWRPNDKWELSLVGQNLLESRHLEFVQESFTLPTEVERGVYGKITFQF
ncbi:TonB-dependent receptor [Desulforhopalus vacuolatus]|uniref:TonB-dependent receptor plug domain-containing protein n=1 Tax=Desulforhopalus vacuolatus TaxID=40414 RepID=UPI001962A72A|nr:TonB-dependent receptor [Desulforhopalus vacuolatus]MBM9520386.1 TonB-dependent receptor [Desulforhopalus vacuolatus]